MYLNLKWILFLILPLYWLCSHYILENNAKRLKLCVNRVDVVAAFYHLFMNFMDRLWWEVCSRMSSMLNIFWWSSPPAIRPSKYILKMDLVCYKFILWAFGLGELKTQHIPANRHLRLPLQTVLTTASLAAACLQSRAVKFRHLLLRNPWTNCSQILLAHLSKSSGWAIVITLCPSSVVRRQQLVC